MAFSKEFLMTVIRIKHRMPTRNLGTIVHKSIPKKDPKLDRKAHKLAINNYLKSND